VNATLIESFHRVAGGGLSGVIGLVLLAGLLVWLALEIFRALSRGNAERAQQKLALEKLRAQVAETKLRCQSAAQAEAGWNGIRKFSVIKKVRECDDVNAFYLKPHDGRPLPAFKPGQYLTFQLDLPGRDKPLIRCYSLSDCNDGKKDFYRVIVKGKSEPVELFECENPCTPPNFSEICARYKKAFDEYHFGRFAEAQKQFSELVQEFSDGPSKTLSARCAELLAHPPANWNGIWKMDAK
jgi:hypothetical protein